MKTNFLRPVSTLATTPPNFNLFVFLDYWGVHTTILDTTVEKPQRNNLLKLGTLKYKCPQLWPCALRQLYDYVTPPKSLTKLKQDLPSVF